MLLFRLGWRNLWRNPRRSLITISAIATAFVILILLMGLGEGVKQQMLENGTGLMLGHVQLHNPEYLPDRSLYDVLGSFEEGVDREALDRELDAAPQILAHSERVYGFALLSTGDHSSGAQIIGIDPEAESEVTTFLAGVESDRTPLAAGAMTIWLGESLAKELEASVGSEVAAVTQAADGSLGNALFTVGGLVRTGLSPVDKSLAVVHLQDLQDLLALASDQIHEVALRVADPFRAESVARSLSDGGGLPPGVEAESWESLAPQLRDYVNISESANTIIVAFVAVFAALGILNTMMMAVFERTREIGMVNALGMLPSQVLTTILLESLFLAAAGLGVGLLVAGGLMSYLTHNGIDLSRWTGELSMLNTRMDPQLRFAWKWDHLTMSAAGLALAALAAAGFPAAKAARLNPIQAMSARTET